MMKKNIKLSVYYDYMVDCTGLLIYNFRLLMLNVKPTVGIIGGAGPTAGGYLFQKVIEVSQEKYGCKRDEEFPHVFLLSYPFTDMLGENVDRKLVESQLASCFAVLADNKVSVAAIACNTLHGFLPSQVEGLQFVHIVEETKRYLEERDWRNPRILCSSTAAKTRLHASHFPCFYPDPSIQKKIDDLIDEVTAGCCMKDASERLSLLIDQDEAVVLGCTELSVIHETEPLTHPMVCNPNQVVAERLCDLTFNNDVI